MTHYYFDILDSAKVSEASGEQVRCWTHHKSLKDGVPHELLAMDIGIRDGDLASLQQAIELLFRRHESLRTFFRVIDEEVRQCIIPYDATVFSPFIYDLSGIPGKEARDAELQRIIDDNKFRLNQMEEPPLIRICIFCLPGNSSHLSLMIHHIIADLWSLGIIYREVSAYYQQLREGRLLQPSPLPLQLRDYAKWQRAWQKKNGETVRRFWQNKLESLGPSPDADKLYRQYRLYSNLPTGEVQKSVEDLNLILSNGKLCSYSSHFGPDVYRRLLQFAQARQCSIWSVLTAGIQLLFYSIGFSGVLMVMPLDGRPLPEFESMIGYLTGAVYLHRRVVRDAEVNTFIREGYFDFLESAMHIIYDQNELGLDGAAMRLHCRVFLDFVTRGVAGPQRPHAEEEHVHRPVGGPGYYALKYSVQESNDSLCACWKYNTVLYSPQRIEFMSRKLGLIIEAMIREPHTTVARLLQSIGKGISSTIKHGSHVAI